MSQGEPEMLTAVSIASMGSLSNFRSVISDMFFLELNQLHDLNNFFYYNIKHLLVPASITGGFTVTLGPGKLQYTFLNISSHFIDTTVC